LLQRDPCADAGDGDAEVCGACAVDGDVELGFVGFGFGAGSFEDAAGAHFAEDRFAVFLEFVEIAALENELEAL
jgi:hypothetical protein